MGRAGDVWGGAASEPERRRGREGGRRRSAGRGRRKGWMAAALLLGAVLVVAGVTWWVRRPVSQPDRAPDFTLEEAGGGQVSLVGFRGHPVALVFFRTFL